MTVTETLDHLLSVFLRPLRTWIEREWVAPLRAAYDAAMQTKEQYRDGVYLHLKERLEGTDEHPLAEGVPVRPLPATQDLEHLQETVELLDMRKVDVYETEVPDGQGLVSAITSTSLFSGITKLIDHSKEWSYDQNILNLFPNLEIIDLWCKSLKTVSSISCLNIKTLNTKIREIHIPYVTSYFISYDHSQYSNASCFNCPNMEVFDASSLKSISSGHHMSLFADCLIEEQEFPSLESISTLFLADNTHLRKLLIPKCTSITNSASASWPCVQNMTALKEVVLGKVTTFGSGCFTDCPQLIKVEFADGVNINLNMSKWIPTLDDTNLEQFLYNFREHIAKKIADRTGQSTLTMTLSQAVRDVLTAEIEDIIVSQKHWVISPAKSV